MWPVPENPLAHPYFRSWPHRLRRIYGDHRSILYLHVWFLGEPQLAATVTYENTTEDFAAAVVTADPQGLRIYYCLLVPGRRTIGIVPWKLEAGDTYRVVYDIDAGDDGKIDIITEQRDLVFPQHGSPIQIDVESWTKLRRVNRSTPAWRSHRPCTGPGVSAQDIRYNPGWNLPTARIYNVSSQPIRNVKIAFYGGFSSAGGKPITVQQIPNIENPNDLAPRMVTVGMNYRLDQPTNIYVAIDPDDEINSEITALKNVAHKRLMDSGVNAKRPTPKPAKLLRKRGRRG